MHWYKTFFANICILLTLTYLASVFNKYLLQGFSRRTRQLLFALAAIGGGWISMFFGLPLADQVRFDLRFVPLIIAPMFVGPSYWLLVIGAGIGLSRLTFSLSPASWVGCMNMVILGLLSAALHEWMKNKPFTFWQKNLCFVLAINGMNVIVIALFGVIPAWEYLSHIAPLTFPMSVLLSAFFSLLLRDFQMEYRRLEHLREANRELAVQYEIAQDKTDELVRTTAALEEHARMLQLSNQYKSEFLANMSHELRTPLNSMLILSQLLAENRNGALPPEEASYAEMIYSSGNDLLRLINEVLDLSKVEAGRLEMVQEAVNLTELPQILERNFQPLAQQKPIAFNLDYEPGLPDLIYTDGQRLQQILMNLLSNAFKFTEKGSVAFSIQRVSRDDVLEAFRIHAERMPEELPEMGFFGSFFETNPAVVARIQGRPQPDNPGGGSSEETDKPLPDWLAFTVQDTGIGIPEDKQSLVFEAFRQADGTTSRKYGGTGLGLSISREFAKLLGGFILLDSEVGRGSRFTLYLPYRTEPAE
ncbi:ATP-binding protein [Gorillibacterium timonense]|uniref:ATP-binding protein n=1 Tax=Gorillibacterium timonense TaxID=1689269 RepID=UPI00071D89F4|nr:ATP-binding protein [Gorillibacterium timonense]